MSSKYVHSHPRHAEETGDYCLRVELLFSIKDYSRGEETKLRDKRADETWPKLEVVSQHID